MFLKTFKSVRNSLSVKEVKFEEISFTDVATSARTIDTSVAHNYNPANSVKTLILNTKTGHQAIILRGSDTIDQIKLKQIVGKWSVLSSDLLRELLGFEPGTLCPLDIDIPLVIDKRVVDLPIWTIGAGDNQKGFNITVEEALKHLSRYNILDISKNIETGKINMNQNDNDLLSRRVANILPSKDGLEKLISGKKIRLYQL
jgi:prolyl-tRNA editing enzyme YbaK/EbsC (Cys-tRNA(Pro) deacylase)